MTEFQILSIQQEMEALKEVKTSFDLAVPQPFLSPPDSEIPEPIWGKTVLPSRGTTSAADVTSELPLFQCVIGINDAGTFRVATANVIGPVTYL